MAQLDRVVAGHRSLTSNLPSCMHGLPMGAASRDPVTATAGRSANELPRAHFRALMFRALMLSNSNSSGTKGSSILISSKIA